MRWDPQSPVLAQEDLRHCPKPWPSRPLVDFLLKLNVAGWWLDKGWV